MKMFRRIFGASLVVSLGVLTACGTSGGTTSAATDPSTNSVAVSSQATPPPSSTATNTTSTTTTATSTGSPNGLTGETTIADNFDASAGIEPTWYGPSGRGGTPPVSADQVGAFRIVCLAGPVLADDPIVEPGQSGKSHLHQFFGNTGVNANSTYASLRTSGGTTCGQASTPLNRSAYWTPAMLDGAGHVVKPDYLQVYYKQIPEGAPECQGAPDANHIGHCIDLPNGIRYVTGYNMATGQGGPTSSGFDPFNMYFQCWDSLDGKVKTPTGAQFKTIADVVAAGCPIGAQLVTIGINPSCWDGVNLDAADHRSHMANEIGTFVASIGLRSCPPDHPYVIPSLQIQYHYTIDANFVAGKWHLSSDDMVAQMTGQPVVAGSTLHFDYWEAWSPTVKATWQKYCVNGHLTCAGGDLGNGTDIKSGDFPPGGPPIHQLIPVP